MVAIITRKIFSFAVNPGAASFEILDHLTVALDQGYLTDDAFQILREKVFSMVKKVNGYISYLERRKSGK